MTRSLDPRSLDPRSLDRPSIASHEKRTVHLRGFLLGAGYFHAAEAMDYAAGSHTGVRRDGRTPEFAHQVYIVSYLSTLLPHLRHPEETLTVGFLHDVVEDHGVSFTEIEARFGPLVASATDAMSKEVDGIRRGAEAVAQRQAGDPVASIVKPGSGHPPRFRDAAARWPAVMRRRRRV